MEEREGRPAGRSAGEPRRFVVPTTATVRNLFDANASHYDRVNRIITFGQDTRWRRWAARQAVESAAVTPRKVLDACAGTGLAGLEAARLGALVTLADLSAGMLCVARERAAVQRLNVETHVVDLATAPAPFPAGSFDAAILAFGLRYLRDPLKAVNSITKMLRQGGKLIVLESVVPPPGLAQRFAEVYFMHVAPLIATTLAGHTALYRMLTATTRATGGATEVLDLLLSAELDVITRRNFAVGLVVGIVARKPGGRAMPVKIRVSSRNAGSVRPRSEPRRG